MNAGHVPPYSHTDGSAPAVFWPALTAEEAEAEWPALQEWVTGLQTRFPRSPRLPSCWYRHNDVVEVLSALRDYERYCFGPGAAASAAFDWQRAHREADDYIHWLNRRWRCDVADGPHAEQPPPRPADAEFQAFVAADLAERRHSRAVAVVRGHGPVSW